MSGGSMDYLYERVKDIVFRQDTPERRAFATLLQKIAQALHDIEWVDSGDYGPGDESAAIQACLAPGATLAQLCDEAHALVQELRATAAAVDPRPGGVAPLGDDA